MFTQIPHLLNYGHFIDATASIDELQYPISCCVVSYLMLITPNPSSPQSLMQLTQSSPLGFVLISYGSSPSSPTGSVNKASRTSITGPSEQRPHSLLLLSRLLKIVKCLSQASQLACVSSDGLRLSKKRPSRTSSRLVSHTQGRSRDVTGRWITD